MSNVNKWSIEKGDDESWAAICPIALGPCQCESFPTHAEAIAYADKEARKS